MSDRKVESEGSRCHNLGFDEQEPDTRLVWWGNPAMDGDAQSVIDRLVQQAILQVLEPLLDPTFSASSYGFRPGRGAHDALAQAREYVAEGRVIVVDMDLEKFFDRVNHDMLMSRLARRVADKRLLRIVRRFLEAGLMQNGVCVERHITRRNRGISLDRMIDDLNAFLTGWVTYFRHAACREREKYRISNAE